MSDSIVKYSVALSFEPVRLPSLHEIHVLGKNALLGKIGFSRSLNSVLPDGFQTIDIHDNTIEAIFVHKSLLRKMPSEKILEVLREKVFPFVSEGEVIRVDFKVNISYSSSESEEAIE